MIDWEKVILTTPPVLSNVPLEELTNHVYSNSEFLPKLPCNTQAVARFIKDVTRASELVNEKDRHGFIETRIQSRSEMPKFESKRYFHV